MDWNEAKEKFIDFFGEYYVKEIAKAISEERGYIEVDFSLIDKFDIELADLLLENPEETLSVAEEALKEISSTYSPSEDTKIRIRLFNLPESREIRIRNLRSKHIGKLIVTEGIVKRASEIRPEISEAVFECLNCGNKISVIQTERIISAPKKCEVCGSRKGFSLVDQKLNDVRWIVIEEPFEIVSGERPSDIMVYLKGDLTTPRMQNKTDPGNRIKVVGILKQMARRVRKSKSRQLEIYIEANNIIPMEVEWHELEITKEDEEKIRELAKDPNIYEKLVQSIAPAIYGLEEVKEAIALQLFGGEPKILPDGTRIRGDIHILLIGDPSTAKSALMKVVANLIPRGRYVSGKGVTAAGLTATVVRDEEFLGGWVLEAGALVLSNGSLCAIDEFEKVDKNDQVALHEAMEQQSYHPSFELMFSDGSKHRIGKFVEDLMRKYRERVVKGKDCEILDVSLLNFKLLDFDGSRIRPVKVLRVSRHKAPKYFVEITYSNGRKILVTPEHPVFVFEDGKIITKDAEKVKPNEFVPGIRFLKVFDKRKELSEINRVGRKKITLPYEIDSELSKFLGFMASEGYSYRGSSYELGISTTSPQISEIVQHSIQSTFSVNPLNYIKKNRTIRIISKDIYTWMTFNFPELMRPAKFKRIPAQIFSLEKDKIKEFILSLFLGDGTLNERPSYTSSSRELIEDLQDLLLIFDIHSRIHEFGQSERKYWKLYINGDSLSKFREIFGYGKVSSKIRHHDVLPSYVTKKLREMLKEFRIYDGYLNAHISNSYGLTRDKFLQIYESLKTKIKYGENLCERGELEELKRKLKLSFEKISRISGLKVSTVKYYFYGGYKKEKREKIKSTILESLRMFLKKKHEELERLKELLNYRWLRIKKVRKIPNKGKYKTEWVYDVTVESHKFVSHGVILHNTISIAKASIVATLPARTAILAGGNPKLGRFDPYLPIREQVQIPETLLTRFDLKFALRDIPNPELDEKIAEHMIRTRYGWGEKLEPPIPPELFRKYVAYARKVCHPTLTEEAARTLKEFYLSLRERSGEDSPISITPRQYEALMRLAEASARIQLRNEVTKEDALRAIRLMSFSLRQFGFEPTTGQIDIDRAEGQKMTAAQRGKIRTMLALVEELENLIGKEIPVKDLIERAKERKIDNADELLRKMLQEGLLYTPKPGFVSRV